MDELYVYKICSCLDFPPTQIVSFFMWNVFLLTMVSNRYSWEVHEMLVKLLSTLGQLLVFHTATPSLTCEPREGNSSVLEEKETAGVSEFKIILVQLLCFSKSIIDLYACYEIACLYLLCFKRMLDTIVICSDFSYGFGQILFL